MFIAFFMVIKKWRQQKHPLIEDWIKKILFVCVCVYIHTHTHIYIYVYIYTYIYIYDGILLSNKKDEILPFATTWMDLESIILSEINQSGNTKNHMIPLVCGT